MTHTLISRPIGLRSLASMAVAVLVATLVVVSSPSASLAQETANSAGTLSGTVFTVDGAPITGAMVSVLSETGDAQTVFTTTDFVGRYALSGLAVGQHNVSVVHPDSPYGAQSITVTLWADEPLSQDFTLQPTTDSMQPWPPNPGTSVAAHPGPMLTVTNDIGLSSSDAGPSGPGAITGVVTDELTELAVPGANVSLFSSSTAGAGLNRSATTDDQGRYSFANLPLTTFTVSVSVSNMGDPGAVEYVFSSVNVALSQSVQAPVRNVVLKRVPSGPGAITGIVRDRSTNVVIEGAQVSLWGQVGGQFGVGINRSTTTNALGEYSFSNLPLASMSLNTSIPNFTNNDPSQYQSSTVNVQLSERAPNRVRDIFLKPAAVGTGSVSGVISETIGATSVPIEGVSITLWSSQGGNSRNTQTDENGRFVVSGLAAGTYQFWLSESGAMDQADRVYANISYLDQFVVVPASNQPVTKNMILERVVRGTAVIGGTLTDSRTGEPIEGANVHVWPSNDQGGRNVGGSATTNVLGQWSVRGLAPGTYGYWISTFSGSGSTSTFEQFTQNPQVTVIAGQTVERVDTLTSVVAGPATLSGRISDAATHLGIANAEVTLTRWMGGFQVVPVRTDATGNYRVSGLPAGAYTLSVQADGYAPPAGNMGSTAIEMGAGAESLNMSMRSAPVIPEGAGEISGVVLDADGQPLNDVSVWAYAPDLQGFDAYRFATTGNDGEFELTELALTRWTVQFQKIERSGPATPGNGATGGFAPASQDISLTETSLIRSNLRVTLEPGGLISGEIDTAAAPPFMDFHLWVSAMDASTGEFITSGSVDPLTRAYSLGGLPSGSYVVAVHQEPGQVSETGRAAFSFASAFWRNDSAAGARSIEGASTIVVGPGAVVTGINVAPGVGGSVSGRVFTATPDGVAELAAGKFVDVAVWRRDEVSSVWRKLPHVSAWASSWSDGMYQVVGLSSGDYRLEFSDYFVGSRSLATSYNGGGQVFGDAPILTIGEGNELTARDVVMSPRRPVSDSSTLVLDQLGSNILDGLRDRIAVPETLGEGDAVVIDVGEELAGEWVTVWANSTPTRLGSWQQVRANGTVTVALPDGLVGAHRLAVQDADGALTGWTPVTIAADEPKADSPGTPPRDGGSAGNSDRSAKSTNAVRVSAVDGRMGPDEELQVEAQAQAQAEAQTGAEADAKGAGEPSALEADGGAGGWWIVAFIGLGIAILIALFVLARRRRIV